MAAVSDLQSGPRPSRLGALRRPGRALARVRGPQVTSAPAAALVWSGLRSLPRRVAARLAPVTGVGWTVIVAALLTWLAGWQLGWLELMDVAALCVLVLLGAIAFTIGRLQVDVSTDLQPQRVAIGESALAQLTVTNSRRKAVWPLRVELPVGQGWAQFDVPRLAPAQEHVTMLEIDTARRAVVDVGPARSFRADPLGLLRRSVTSAGVSSLYVHPRTVALHSLGHGILRDLEGRRTDDTSTSDVELHTLREYVPGDDRRYVHWRTTARTGRLMVRQFVDTRRSHLALVLSAAAQDYRDEADFETAISAVASVGAQALAEQQAVTAVCAGQPLNAGSRTLLLDAASGLTFGGGPSLATMSGQLRRTTPTVTMALLVTGGTTDLSALRAAAARWPRDVRVVAIRVDAGATTAFHVVGDLLVLTLTALEDLPRLLWLVSRR